MLILSLWWLLLGCLVGTLANAARLPPGAWGRRSRLVLLGVGALAALLGGWLGTLLLGRYVATAVALWVAVLGVVMVCCIKGIYSLALPARR
jgi:uncharacterized membrane protein YeaQ/YmgE (transglycosylase-associated protein family)